MSMAVELGIIFAIIAMVGWGIGNFLNKKAVLEVGVLPSLIYKAAFMLPLIFFCIADRLQPEPPIHTSRTWNLSDRLFPCLLHFEGAQNRKGRRPYACGQLLSAVYCNFVNPFFRRQAAGTSVYCRCINNGGNNFPFHHENQRQSSDLSRSIISLCNLPSLGPDIFLVENSG